jgi:hypothetical protein
MAGYHNDQYFLLDSPNSGESGIDLSGANTSGFFVKDADNPKFIYPDRTIRTDDPDGYHARVMRRGYIRSLMTYANHTDIKIRKCQFQFNPSQLVQSVSANDSMLNFLQQDPAQYSQPMPANVNFTFELFFDRSMEINNDSGKVNPNSANPWETEDPGQVGVLRDLSAFFGVIGQGLSLSQTSYLTQVLGQRVKLEASQLSTTETPVDPAKAVNNIPSFLKVNIANSAFLLPLPVRIVFSALYIVEGLVTNTTVTFTKFSTSMVPMQCTLQVTLEAKYIGFANKDTFLTSTLAAAEAQIKAEEKAAVVNAQSLVNACNAAMGNMDVAGLVFGIAPVVFGDDTVFSASTLDDLLQTKGKDRFVNARFPMAVGDDLIQKVFTEGTTQLHIEANAGMAVWGPFTNLSQYTGSRSAADQTALANLCTTSLLLFSGDSVSSSSSNGVATDVKSWKDMKADTSGAKGSTTTGWDQGAYTFGTSWFILRCTGRVSVTADDNKLSGDGAQYFVVKGSDNPYAFKNINLNWPVVSALAQYETPSSVGGYVAPDNTVTTPKQAGSSSKVGTPPNKNTNRNII